MGYSYQRNANGRMILCCDICGAINARKYACPFGYCQAVAACQTCRKDPKNAHCFGKAGHRKHGCEVSHNKFMQQKAEEESIIAQGGALRKSALATEGDTVHVLFLTKTGYVGYYMNSITYHSIPLMTPATPDDYRKHGELLDAPSDFHHRT